jgi:uncharacterized membrane protein YjgN (DUF898 family)
MKVQEGFGKFLSRIIGFLLWLFPIIGAIIGGYIQRGYLSTESYSYYYENTVTGDDVFKFFLGIVLGCLAGIIFNVIVLGPTVILINIMNYTEEIRNKIHNAQGENTVNSNDNS